MVCGTASDAGKTTVVTGLCRLLARRGVRVAPFKAQNMALNSVVTRAGHEIGRAQGVQALAAGVEPDVAMNPILLKPTGERSSQVVVRGRAVGVMTAAEYHAAKPELLATVLESLADLRRRFDVVLCEGAGRPAEINLLDHDIVNLRVAAEAGFPALVVGDIDRGGVFAALYGTVALLPDELRRLVRGFVINKFRGDPAPALRRHCRPGAAHGRPDARGPSDAAHGAPRSRRRGLAGPRRGPAAGGPAVVDGLDVAVVRFPFASNVTDLDALAIEPGVAVRLVRTATEIGRPDLVVLPGTKATVADLAWLRAGGFPDAIAASGADVLGICGGYQMLGDKIDDPVESGRGVVPGLGWLAARTVFEADKVVRRVGTTGYEIHHGRVAGRRTSRRMAGCGARRCTGCSRTMRSAPGSSWTSPAATPSASFPPAFRSPPPATARFDVLADAIEAHVDIDAIERLIDSGLRA